MPDATDPAVSPQRAALRGLLDGMLERGELLSGETYGATLELLADAMRGAGMEIVPVHRGALRPGQSAYVQLAQYERALTERNAALADLAAARKYAVAWVACCRVWAGGSEIDGFTLQDIGLKSGALLETVYDPARHGEADCEPGDSYFVLPDDARRLAPDAESVA